MYSFNSTAHVGPSFGNYSQDQVKNEPMFFNCSADFAHENGGPITKGFIDSFIVNNFFDHDPATKYVFDSRVHMLMRGWFPCIPGFHHDDVPRSKTNGQPNYDDPEYRSKHCLGLVNGEICPTQFAIGQITLPHVRDDEIAYKVWHPLVEQSIRMKHMRAIDAPSNHLVYFDDESFHQGTRALDGGWRWFGRISWDTDRVNNVTNEIRRQAQVYLEFPMEGW